MASWFDLDDATAPAAPTRTAEPPTQSRNSSTVAVTSDNANNDNSHATLTPQNTLNTTGTTTSATHSTAQSAQTLSHADSATAASSSTITDDSLLALNEIEAEMSNIHQQYQTQLLNEITHNIQHIDTNKNINPYAALIHNTDNVQFHSHIVQTFQKRVQQRGKVQSKVSDITALGISDRKAFKLVHSTKKSAVKQKRAAEHSDKVQHKLQQNNTKNKQRKRAQY